MDTAPNINDRSMLKAVCLKSH